MLTRLPHRLVVQESTITASGGGTFTETWTTSSTIWANVQLSSNESFAEDKINQLNFYDITIRKMNISNLNRFVYKGDVLIIQNVSDPTQKNHLMKISARREV